MVRCFIALDLPDRLKEKIWTENLIVGQFGKMSFVKKDNMHVTLRFLGHISEEQVQQFKELIDSVEMEPFKIRLKGVGVFPSLSHAKVVWVGITEGEEKIIQLSSKLGSTEPQPHVTVARVKSLLKRKGLRDYVKSRERTDFGEFECKKITLYKSELGYDSAQYTELHSKTLA